MTYHNDGDLPGYREVGERLAKEFTGVHDAATVTRCVTAARHGAQDVTGSAPPDLVERIARKHLQVLAIVAAEKKRQVATGATADLGAGEGPAQSQG
ncbi:MULTISPECIES: hypothetical protein [Thermomonospora]|uniref:Uncharacterized protein n=1 Tax=Thermomonospora curvata (strain ATCC 19995 / DSM 43183 / JCM 3096 / KCTC 9072 / NBRC 15933 / NCIMB 10081 / Henssen B9) TaxID=471852 RepID=D1A8D7_THECD|nr:MULTISPECIES: hypothetical protein [Thermomonospora]ACZ00452.1 hypothetical protein Tcur_4936 [Thermomonospora curvata DSM 43183]